MDLEQAIRNLLQHRDIDQAEQILSQYRVACWDYLSDQDERRQVQNRLSQTVKRSRDKGQLENIEDYCTLLSKIDAMSRDPRCRGKGRLKDQVDRPRRDIRRSKVRKSERLAQQKRNSGDLDRSGMDIHHQLGKHSELLEQDPTITQMTDTSDEVSRDLSAEKISLPHPYVVDRQINTHQPKESISGSFLMYLDPLGPNVQSSLDEFTLNINNESISPLEHRYETELPLEAWNEVNTKGGQADSSSSHSFDVMNGSAFHHCDNPLHHTSNAPLPESCKANDTNEEWWALLDFETNCSEYVERDTPISIRNVSDQDLMRKNKEELDHVQNDRIIRHLRIALREKLRL